MRKRGWVILAVLACGCGNQDVDCLERLCGKTADKLEAAAGGPNGRLADGWHAVRGAMGDAGLDSRVALRLHWDKALADAAIDVQEAGPGVVRLQGAVADEGKRARAEELAGSTEGVERVINELTAASPP
jgi:osmotically-inducible protein OsmY